MSILTLSEKTNAKTSYYVGMKTSYKLKNTENEIKMIDDQLEEEQIYEAYLSSHYNPLIYVHEGGPYLIGFRKGKEILIINGWVQEFIND